MKGNNMKVKKTEEISHIDILKQKIKQLKDEARVANAYKKLILTAAKSKYEPKNVVSGLKFAAKLIDKKDWYMVEKVAGTSGDLMVRGVCPKCDINLIGKELRPREFTLPCFIQGCTFNKKENKKEIQ